jgi:cellulose synthase/poly-beta-1,6-N-acetylglucosamine synthase-like glycosyltransferase
MTWLLLLLVLGVNMTFWGGMGILRSVDERVRRRTRPVERNPSIPLWDVAVMIAAHNEEAVIGASLGRLLELIPADCVHVVSDWSSDRTVQIARDVGVNVVETPKNVGKAAALTFGRDHFGLLDKFRAVMILDADTKLDRRYFELALPMFDDPRIVAVAGCAHTWWQRKMGVVGNVLVTHRQRVYLLTQWLLKYGQTWRGISATLIVPGFASMYRCDALREIQIEVPGLIIEDFNMTFQVHAKRLGRIAFHPMAKAYTQDPSVLRDYIKQVRRWDLGLWQTIRRWLPKRPVFLVTVLITVVELVLSSLMMLLLPLVGVAALVALIPAVGALPVVAGALAWASGYLGFPFVVYVIVGADYLLTCVVAFAERRPQILLAGMLSIPMRVIDAALALYTLPRAWLDRSDGQWVSPTRRALTTEESPATSIAVPILEGQPS